MKRRLGSALSVALMLTALTSCGDAARTVTEVVGGDDEQAQEALDDYREDLASLADREQKLLDRYAAVQGPNYTTDRAMYRTVTVDLPKWIELGGDLQTIEIEDDQLADIHDLYIEANQARIRGFTLLLAAIENYDRRAGADANDSITESNQLTREWQRELDDFIEDVEG